MFFSNTPCVTIDVVNDSQVKAVVPVGATNGKIKITTSFGSYTTSVDYVVDPGGGTGGSSGGGGGGGYTTVVPPDIALPTGSMVRTR